MKTDSLEVEKPKEDTGLWIAVLMLLTLGLPFVAQYPENLSSGTIERIRIFSIYPILGTFIAIATVLTIVCRIRRYQTAARILSGVLTLLALVLAYWMMETGKRDGPALYAFLNSPNQPSLGLYLFGFLSYYGTFVRDSLRESWRYTLPLAIALLVVGHGVGLFIAPEEMMMRAVGRILYVHVPTAWIAMLTYLIAFVIAIASLWSGLPKWDARLQATIEVGVVLSLLLTIQGSIWAKPTWGVWWSWDPRLTTTAIMVISFAGVLLLRASIPSVERRMTITGVGAILAFVNVPIVYLSVKWWNTLHQDLSSPNTVSSTMVFPLRIAAFGMLFLTFAMIARRAYTLLEQLEEEWRVPDLPQPHAKPLDLED